MSNIIILRDDVEPTYWMHCQYGHHWTCGGTWARTLMKNESDNKPECACPCHEPAREAVRQFALEAAIAAYG